MQRTFLEPGTERFELQYSKAGVDIGEFRTRPEHAWQTKPRLARYFHVAVVRRGALARVVDGRPMVSTPGAGRLIWGDEEFGFTQPIAGESQSTGIYFEADRFFDLLERSGGPGVGPRGERMRTRHFLLSPEDRLLLWDLAGRLERRQGGDDRLAIEELALLVAAGAMRSACQIAGAPRPSSRLKDPRLVAGDVRAVLADQYAQTLTVGEIARQVHLSPYHLCRQFRRETGSTIHQELERIRLCAALEGLKQGANDLDELALSVGYSGRGHFGARFKHVFAHSPSDVRARLDQLNRTAAAASPGS